MPVQLYWENFPDNSDDYSFYNSSVFIISYLHKSRTPRYGLLSFVFFAKNILYKIPVGLGKRRLGKTFFST